MKKMCLLLVLFMSFIISVNAEEDITCNYNSKAAINKIAYGVTANYEFKTAEDGTQGFDIAIYNITDDIRIEISSDLGMETLLIDSSMTSDGIYKFYVDDIDNIIKYNIVIYANKYGCENKVRTVKVTKPKYNEIANLSYCNEMNMKDSMYCQEWIKQDFKKSYSEIIDEIRSKLAFKDVSNNEQKNTESNVSENDNKEKMNVIVLSLMFLNILIIAYFIYKRKKEVEDEI